MTPPGSSWELGRAGAPGREEAVEEVVSSITKSRILIIGCGEGGRKIGATGKRIRMAAD